MEQYDGTAGLPKGSFHGRELVPMACQVMQKRLGFRRLLSAMTDTGSASS